MSLAALPPRPRDLPLSGHMRIALGLLHAGALFREAGGCWRSRAFPEQPVRDITVRGLEERGLILMQEYEGLHGIRRACVTISVSGVRAYRGGRLACRRPPPVQAEGVLREIEIALAALDQEAAGLDKRMQALAGTEAQTRRMILQAQDALTAMQSRLAKLERARENLDARRADLRALVAQAGERIAETLTEAGR